jgi:hypothetical protein
MGRIIALIVTAVILLGQLLILIPAVGIIIGLIVDVVKGSK